ncbi:hypothetical protein LTR09_002268 [Extremus antarcticus]|uniref:Uncharacterized protein n=1 Tax=Extremus antarcticus TaxID=702011 RepID=A0AAJ0GGX1_9PEZI|nr:hypothetical protein LTR09_002268 [Extremus antarcticus]
MDEDDFDDDGLDAIPDNTLQQLEQTAFTSTQGTRPKTSRGPQNHVIQTYGATGLSRNGNLGKTSWRPPQPRKSFQQPIPSEPAASAPDPPSSDYGFDDEDVIDLDEPSAGAQAPSALPTRARTTTPGPVAARNVRYGSKPPLDPETEAAFAAADAELGAPEIGPWTHAPHLAPKPNDSVDVSSLQARIAELEAEKAHLGQAEEAAQRAVQAKLGEIAIVRSNQDKATKEYERRISIMQKLHADESAKQKADIEATRKQREKMETDNRFLQHDLAQESERAKRLTGPGKARTAGTGLGTPRKASNFGLGDGFADDEVRVISPSKSKDKSREQTPKVGAKRKRPAQDSPIAPLSFTQPVRHESLDQQPPVVETKVVESHSTYAFMQRTLNHCPYEGHIRSVEALAKYALPSNDRESLSSMLLASLTSPLISTDENMPLKLSRIMLRLWRRCLEEEYYKPVYLMLDMIRFALRGQLANIRCQLIEEAVPICVRSVNLVTDATFQASSYPSFASGAEYAHTQANVAPYIDVDEILEFLKELCDAASLSSENIQVYWRTVDFKSLLLMLNRAQPLSQITTALHMLKTSCLPTSFGCIADLEAEDGAQKQVQQEKSTIERLTSMLFEIPQAPSDEPAYTDREIFGYRLEVLAVLRSICQSEHGGLQLAQYRTAIGRLIRFLDAQVCRLYTTRPAIGLEVKNDETAPHTLVAQTINTTVRLVYHLLRAHSEVINLQQKLAVFKGGWHKFLISMTRIAFSDRLVFEEGLDEESVEAAHQILDSVLSPEEGEAVVRAVETPRGTKGSSTEQNTESEGEDAMEEDPG